MDNIYTQCYVHLAFAVKNRDSLIKLLQKNEVEFKEEYVFIFFDDVFKWE